MTTEAVLVANQVRNAARKLLGKCGQKERMEVAECLLGLADDLDSPPWEVDDPELEVTDKGKQDILENNA